MRRVSLERLHGVVQGALTNYGLRSDAAACIASVVRDAERDGCASHGIFRVPGFLHALASGAVDGSAAPATTQSTAPGVVTVDGQGGFAAPAFAAGRTELVQRTKINGIACLALQRVRHFSALWWEVEQLAGEDQLIALAFVNSAAFVAHSPGGLRPVYGTNPFAFGCPRGPGRPPLVFDQASSTMARGEMQLAMKAGQMLPAAAAIFEGAETRDPQKALSRQGAQLPFGAHKGTNIALMVELLAGAATKSPLAPEAAVELEQMALSALDTREAGLPAGGAPTVNGELVIAIDPAMLGFPGGSAQEPFHFVDRVEVLLRAIQASATMEEIGQGSQGSGLRLPADRRQAQRQRTIQRGGKVDVDAGVFAEVEEKARKGR